MHEAGSGFYCMRNSVMPLSWSAMKKNDTTPRLAQFSNLSIAASCIAERLSTGGRDILTVQVKLGLLQIQIFELLARPGCFAQKLQAGLDAGLMCEAADR